MAPARELSTLREQLLEVAFKAREDRIGKHARAYSQSKAQVEEIISNLRALYRKQPALFDTPVLEDIRTAKVCAGIITRDDLELSRDEARKKAALTAHKQFLKKQRVAYKGTQPGLGKQQEANCLVCQEPLDRAAADIECVVCGWLICPCGACGCTREKKE